MAMRAPACGHFGDVELSDWGPPPATSGPMEASPHCRASWATTKALQGSSSPFPHLPPQGQACNNNKGNCTAGSDVDACFQVRVSQQEPHTWTHQITTLMIPSLCF